MPFVCFKCGKELSTNQALQKHMKSSRCIPRTSSDDKLFRESYAVIECNLEGMILEIDKKSFQLSPSPKLSTITGKSFYELIVDDTQKRYDVARTHISLLTTPDAVMRFDDIALSNISSIVKRYNIIMKIMKNSENRLNIYVNTIQQF